MKRKNFEVAAVGESAREYAPRRWPGVTPDVVTPLLQAVVTGLLLAMIATGVLWGVFELAFAQTFGVSFCVSVTLAWFWRLGVVTETLWDVEERTGLDLDRDGVVGRPGPQTVRLEIVRGNHTQYVDIDGLEDSRRLRTLAILALTNRLSERAVNREFGWSRDRWVGVRDGLVERKWAKWDGDPGSTQGIIFTDEGREIMQEVLAHVT